MRGKFLGRVRLLGKKNKETRGDYTKSSTKYNEIFLQQQKYQKQ